MNSFNRILYPGKRYGLVDRGEAPRRYWGYMLFYALALMLFVAMTIWSA